MHIWIRIINTIICKNNPRPRIEPPEMIKGKVSNDVRAQEPGTELCAAQAAKYTDELASVVKSNYPPLSTDWVY